MIRCDIYKGSKRQEMYLYVPSEAGLKQVPEQLLETFGELQLVMSLVLDQTKKLARADIATVMTELQSQGYYLQMPPSNWSSAKRSENA